MRLSRAIYAMAVTLSYSTSQASNVINFDDLSGSTPDCAGYLLPNNAACKRIPGTYNDFTWDNGWAINGCVYSPSTGYCRSTVSRPNTLFNGYSAPMSIRKSDRGQFNFYGASIGIAWSPGWITFTGRRNGSAVYAETRNVSLDPTFIALRYYNIDELYITSANQMVMDDFSLSNSLCQTPGLTYNVTSPALLGNQIFYSFADFNTCFGSVLATSIDQGSGAYAESSNWEAGCNLSGPETPATTQVPSGPSAPCSFVPRPRWPASAQGVANRTLVTFDTETLKAVNLFSRPDGSQSNYVDTASPLYGTIHWLNYIGGATHRESTRTGPDLFRQRTSQLGEIVNSSPVAVGPSTGNYDTIPTDRLKNTDMSAEANSYAAFRTRTASRPNVVYVGSNDGFVHAFRAGLQDANGVTVSTAEVPNDGRELMAYAPSNALATLHSRATDLRYSDKYYDHNYFVDATPAVGDAYVNGRWQTFLVGGLGAGGNASGPVSDDQSSAAGLLYAVNITDPNNFTRSGVEGQTHFIQELNSGHAGVAGTTNKSSILCENTPAPDDSPGSCAKYLGAIYGTPAIRRMHNGRWNILVGNGLYSQSGKAGLFFFNTIEDLNDGNNYWVDSGAPTIAGQKNGIVHITPVDLDGDNVVDYVYAGDLQGNVWRFDFTNINEVGWATTAPTKVFSTPDGQPITTKLIVTTLQTSAGNAVLVEFGTGRAWPLQNSFGNHYASGVQSLYGVMDWQMAKWNRRSATKFFMLDALPRGSSLVTQTINGTRTIQGVKYRTIASSPVCWLGASSISGCTNYKHYGWKIDLPGVGNAGFREQVVFDPQLVNGVLVVNTLTPGWPLDTSEGYTMTVTNIGGAPPNSFFRNASDTIDVIGANLNGLGTAVFLRTNEEKWEMYQKNTSQRPTVTDVNGNASTRKIKRQTWSRLR